MASAKECDDRHEKLNVDIKDLYDRSLPTWVRAILISAVTALYLMLGGMYLYAATTFATKNEVQDLRAELQLMRQEIRTDMRDGFNRLEKRLDERK